MDEGFSQRLTELRIGHGYSQEQLGKMLYVSRQAVSKWECGEAFPDIDNLTALAKLYNISLDELVGGAEITQEKKTAWICKPHKRLFAIASIVLILLPFAILFIWLLFLPDSIPAHYNGAGQVDRWGSKFELLSICAVNPIVAIITTTAALSMRKHMSDGEKNKLVFIVFTVDTFVFCGFIAMTVIFAAKAASIAGRNAEVDMYNVASVVCSSLVMVAGAVMPFTKPNMILGVRTSTTMSDPLLWKKINIISGAAFFAEGVGLNVFNLLYSNSYVNLAVTVAVMTVTAAIVAVLSLCSGRARRK